MDKPVQGKEVEPVLPKEELTEEDMDRIREVFSEEIVPKLARRQARIGVLGCGFAGPEYSRWAVRFTSRGAGFQILDFEYDADGYGMDLAL